MIHRIYLLTSAKPERLTPWWASTLVVDMSPERLLLEAAIKNPDAIHQNRLKDRSGSTPDYCTAQANRQLSRNRPLALG